MSVRKEVDRVHKISKRASETHEETLKRQTQNKVHMESMRASETGGSRLECINLMCEPQNHMSRF